MALTLKNTYTKSFETFKPLDPAGRRVLMYSCGPTVYSFAHIGNFRSFLLGDLLRRVLIRRGYEVVQVMNITDVGHMTQDHLADATGEDKLSKAARELGWDPFQVARHYETAFVEDARALRLLNYRGTDGDTAALHPRATDYVAEMLVLIQALIEKGFAYTDSDGQVYFEIERFPEYGMLSGKKIDELESGSRVEVREEKRDPRDFALWKADSKHLMQWDPHSSAGWDPWAWERFRQLAPHGVDKRIGKGFPGWHIECSAMARACLADVIDIHTGGEDNIFPHHECEIAQSYCALGMTVPAPDDGPPRKNFSRFWLHGRHLLVDNHKMSKRDGTFFTVRDLLDPRRAGRADLADRLAALGFPDGRVPARVLRYALLSVPYTQPMNFGDDLLAQARASLGRIQGRYDRLREVIDGAKDPKSEGPAASGVRAAVKKCREDFDVALDDNLDVANALSAVFVMVSELNQVEVGPAEASDALSMLQDFDEIFDVLDHQPRGGLLTFDHLKLWSDAAWLAEHAKGLDAWRADDRSDLRDALAKGELPSADAIEAVAELDASVVELFLGARAAARVRKDFAVSDRMRATLQKRNVVIEDTPAGVRWKLP